MRGLSPEIRKSENGIVGLSDKGEVRKSENTLVFGLRTTYRNTGDMRILAEEIFNCPEAVGGMTWTQVHERIEKLENLKRDGARRRFKELTGSGIIKKNCADLWMTHGVTVQRCNNGANNGAAPCRIATVQRCSAYIYRRVTCTVLLPHAPHPNGARQITTLKGKHAPIPSPLPRRPGGIAYLYFWVILGCVARSRLERE
jgi:hypothetical protein